MTTLNVRIEKDVKNKANKTLSSLGLDMSTAIKLFLNQVIAEDGLPFTPTKNMSTIKARWDKEVVDALKNGERYTSAKALLDDILK